MSEVNDHIEQYNYRAAGRSERGGKNEANAEYVCCIDFSPEEGIRGIYGVADGAVGGHKPEQASELAVDTFNKLARRYVEEGNLTAPEILGKCVFGIHEVLLKQNDALEVRDARSAVSFVLCILENNTAHIAYAGGGVAYLAEHGKISRLTEKFIPDDIDTTDPDGPKRGSIPAGWSTKGFSPLFITQALGPSSRLVFCSDGVHSRVDNVTIHEKLLEGNTVEEGIDLILEQAHARNDSEDVSAVVVWFHRRETEAGPEYVEGIKYPVQSIVKKYITVAVFIALIVALILYVKTDLVKNALNIGSANRGVVDAAQDQEDMDEQSGRSLPAGQVDSGPSCVISIQTEPSGARIFLNGLEEDEKTPADVVLSPGSVFEIRVEADGYQPYVEKVLMEEGMRLERILTLEPYKPGNGSLLVICRPECTGLTLNGKEIKGFPKEEILMREIPPGDYVLNAIFGDVIKERKVSVVSGITQSILFRRYERSQELFGNETEQETQEIERNMVEVVETPAIKSAPEKIEPETKIERAAPLLIKGEKKSAPAKLMEEVKEVKRVEEKESERKVAPEPEKRAFVTVNTNVSGCNIMLFRDGRLEAAGFSGSVIDVQPGNYSLVAARAGYQDKTLEVRLEAGRVELEMNIEIRE